MDAASFTNDEPAGADSMWVFPSSSPNGLPTSASFTQPAPVPAPPASLEQHMLQLESHKVHLELVRETMRLREMELQIASERRREREVELELAKWKAAQAGGRDGGQAAAMTRSTFGPPATHADLLQHPFPAQPFFSDPSLTNTNALGLQPFLPFPATSGEPESAAFDSFLRELLLADPSYLAGGTAMDIPVNRLGEGRAPREEEESQDDIEPMSGADSSPAHLDGGTGTSISGSGVVDPASPAPVAPAGPSRKSKKQVLTHVATCTLCTTPIATLFLRGTPSELSDEFTLHYLCKRCASPVQGASGRARKRVKQTEDVSLPTVCDVCLKGQGRGGIVPRAKGKGVRFAVEMVCLRCTERYKRCSDCGGGSGRLGVGRWRCKELFYEDRKTCNLSHARLGTGELELAVWDVPGDIREEHQVQPVLDACENFWRDNVLRLAVPEILDSEGESPLGLRTYADIETKILDRGWPAREHVMKDSGEERKKYLALTWAKTRTRRAKNLRERKDPNKDGDYLFGNMKRTKILYPAGCVLVGMWICNWDIDRRSVHMSTTSPFDPRDFEDQSMVSIAETISRIVTDGMSNASLVPPSNWWLTYDVICPVILARAEDMLIKRKRCFPLQEYVKRHPEVGVKDFVEPGYTRTVDSEMWAAGQKGEGRHMEHVIAVAKFLGVSTTWLKMQRFKERIYDKRIAAAEAKKRKANDDKPGPGLEAG